MGRNVTARPGALSELTLASPMSTGVDHRPIGARSPAATSELPSSPDVKIAVEGLNFYYSDRRVLEDIHLTIRSNEVTALIGPSGCGKSTFLRTLNRMNDIVPGARAEGTVTIDGQNIYGPSVDVVGLRRRV